MYFFKWSINQKNEVNDNRHMIYGHMLKVTDHKASVYQTLIIYILKNVVLYKVVIALISILMYIS